MWLNIRTGYSFKAVFGHLDEVLARCKGYAGMADLNSTYGFVKWKKECEKLNIKPIYGVRIKVSDLDPRGTKTKRYQNNEFTFIATTTKALQEIYSLVDLAHQQFYQFPKITYEQLNNTSEEVIILSGIAPEFNKIKRKVYLQLSPNLPENMLDCGLEPVACIDNYYPCQEDKTAYESFTVDQWTMERKTSPMHILTEKEWSKLFPGNKAALKLKNQLLKKASDVELPIAPMVKYNVDNSNETLKVWCVDGVISRAMNFPKAYNKRLKTELKVIKEKGFADYFLIVADLIDYCKQHMTVGPARGSAAGSLVCYLLGITEVDPLKYGLLFERFIDINRLDWPDIDFDLQDKKRHLAIDYLQKKYGSDCVAQIGNINKLQPKSAISRVAKALNITVWDVEEFKESIEERPEGDVRARKAIKDSFDSKLGKAVLKEHPNFYHVESLEGHPSHVGKHAAGILVCPEPIKSFCGINSRDKNHVAMIDKRDAEAVNLLKIDALGLTTLNVLAEVCDQLKKPYGWLYTIPLDDKKTYKLINKQNLSGIFQMEGAALQELAKGVKLENIEDLAALSALCRPGPLGSGAAHKYIKQKAGKAPVEYLSKNKAVIKWTKETLGNIVYQEQLMGIIREMGVLSWEDVTKVRKLMGKSQGDEAFSEYKEAFVSGAIKNGSKKEEAKVVWEAMRYFGKYGFNKSHAVSYAILTYLTAYFKANHPLEFAVGILNSTKNNLTALKILRDLKKREGITHKYFDEEHSLLEWSVHNNKLYAGLTTIQGIGPATARKYIECKRRESTIPAATRNHLETCLTPFKYLYPGKEVYGEYYKGKTKYGKVVQIKSIKKNGYYTFIGMLTKRTIKDLNDAKQVAKRKGEKVSGPSAYVSMVMEDDTGYINVSIGRFHFEDIGGIVTDNTQINKDWFVAYGKLVKKYKRIYIEDIEQITQIY